MSRGREKRAVSEKKVIRCMKHNRPVYDHDVGCDDFEPTHKNLAYLKECFMCKHSKK
jgi:hypothetical protein